MDKEEKKKKQQEWQFGSRIIYWKWTAKKKCRNRENRKDSPLTDLKAVTRVSMGTKHTDRTQIQHNASAQANELIGNR